MTSLLLAAVVAFTPADAKLAHETANALVEGYTPRDSGSLGSRRAAYFLLDSISSTGADAKLDAFTADTPLGKRIFTNVESAFVSNPDNEWLVFVSHFDTKVGVQCPGANDGASTTGLLVALAEKLVAATPDKVNVLLLWTDGEECIKSYGPNDGLWGSRHAAKKLKQSGAKVRAVICLDMLGDKNLKISIPENCHKGFRAGILQIAERKKVADKVVSCSDVIIDDHDPFVEQGFKAINLIDFEYGSAPGLNDYWHTKLDTIDKISEDSLLFAGQVLTWIINGLNR